METVDVINETEETVGVNLRLADTAPSEGDRWRNTYLTPSE